MARVERHCGELIDRIAAGAPVRKLLVVEAVGDMWVPTRRVPAGSPRRGRVRPHSTRIVQRKRRLFTKAQVLLTAFVLGLEPLNSDRTISASRGAPRLVQRIYIDLAYGETLSPPPQIGFAEDSSLEGGGFEPPVPLAAAHSVRRR